MSKRTFPAGEKTRKRIVEFLRRYQNEHGGQAPTVREIADGTGIPSTSIVAYHLRRLAEQGLVDRKPGISRGTSLAGSQAKQASRKDARRITHATPASLRQMQTAA